jgi:hypothetical protein
MQRFSQPGRILIAAGGVTALWLAFVAAAALMAPPLPALAAAGGTQVPFKGRATGLLERDPLHGGGPGETDWSITIRGTARATQLGRVDVLITNDDVKLVDPTHLGPTDAASFGEFTGPNGDRVFGIYHWVAGPALAPGILSYSGTFEITGGAGRFEGATGSGTFEGTGNVFTNEVQFTFDGTVSPPHAPQ